MCLLKYDRLLFLFEIMTLTLFIQLRARTELRSDVCDLVCLVVSFETLLWNKVVGDGSLVSRTSL